MSHDYLWDGEGPIDEDVAWFEERVGELAHGSLRAIPPRETGRRSSWTGLWIGALAGIAATLALVWALHGDAPHPQPTEVRPASVPVTRSEPRLPLRHVSVLPPVLPTPSPPESAEEPALETPRPKPKRRTPKSVGVPTDRPEGDRIAGQVLAYGRQIRRCFVAERGVPTGALLWMRFEVTGDGAVTRPRLERHNLEDEPTAQRVAECLAAVLRLWRLPPSESSGSIVAPFVHPGQRAP